VSGWGSGCEGVRIGCVCQGVTGLHDTVTGLRDTVTGNGAPNRIPGVGPGVSVCRVPGWSRRSWGYRVADRGRLAVFLSR
jgi:hypothetical protein